MKTSSNYNSANVEAMQARFHQLVAMLRGFGFKGEVLLKAGLVIIGAQDRHSASLIRRSFKGAKSTASGTLTEVRSKSGGAAFVWVDDAVALSRQEIRELAIAA